MTSIRFLTAMLTRKKLLVDTFQVNACGVLSIGKDVKQLSHIAIVSFKKGTGN
jgi:hypothetical protein